jgi:tetratricopeptide (TPR) repeat protein
MKTQFDRQLAAVRIRCLANALLQQLAAVLATGGVLAAMAIAAERVFAVRVLTPWTLYGAAGAAAAAAVVLAALRMPSRMQVAVLMDRRLAFRERFSTALALAASNDPFAHAAAEEAHRAAERIDPGTHFPIRPSRRWAATLASWAAAGAVAVLVPHDALGFLAQHNHKQAEQQLAQLAGKEVKEQATAVVSALKQLKNDALTAEAARLAEGLDGAKPEELRREAMRKLGDLADKIRQMEKKPTLQAAEAMKEMLKQLKATSDPLSRELDQALQRGDFDKAAETVRKLAEQINGKQLNEEDQKKLAEQLDKLGRQCEQMSDAKKQLEEALKNAGLDGESAKKLAGLSDQEIREELKNRGLSDEQIEKIMRNLDKLRQACRNCKNLGDQLGKCENAGQLDKEGLARLLEQLQDLDEAGDEMARLEDALREIDRACGNLGEGQCQGLAGVGGQCNGPPKNAPGGNGGRAWGDRPTGGPEPVKTSETGVQNKPGAGKTIASWYFKGAPVKGESRKELKEVVRSAGDAAADAIRDNKIPKAYEESVKKYFGEMERAKAVDANR